MARLDLTVEVTDSAGLGESASVAVTVDLPTGRSSASPMVCVAKPGGGFSRGYFTADLPGPGPGSQSRWHAERGWIMLSVDPLGVGGSSTHHDPARLGIATVTAASHAAEQFVLARLREGALHPDLDPVVDPVVVGAGHSMGGCLTIAQQGRHHAWDGIAILGFSAVHSHPAAPPGEEAIVVPWQVHDPPAGAPLVVNSARIAAARRAMLTAEQAAKHNEWLFHYDDVDRAALAERSAAEPDGPEWISPTYPTGVTRRCLTPGVVAAEAAAVEVPVLVVAAERDVIPDPSGEARAYRSAPSVDLFRCSRTGHMHNFASKRELIWQRLHLWGEWVRAMACARRSAQWAG